MAADPGSSGNGGALYHLFLTRIPPKLPKEEVEAVLSAELASRRIEVLGISVVPQSAWKNKGFGFVVLGGSPSPSTLDAVAAELDNNVRVGGKTISPKPVSLWGRDVYGSIEKMLLAIGDGHFGGGWSLQGTIADRNAILFIGNARHMRGWDALRDPLPIATLLRLAASKQRLEGIQVSDSGSGRSSPTVCRQCSDCGSLSAMPSTEQPSCSQSEASWSLRSLYTVPAATGDDSASDGSSSLCTPSHDTEAAAQMATAAWASGKPMMAGSCGCGSTASTALAAAGTAASTSAVDQAPAPMPGKLGPAATAAAGPTTLAHRPAASLQTQPGVISGQVCPSPSPSTSATACPSSPVTCACVANNRYSCMRGKKNGRSPLGRNSFFSNQRHRTLRSVDSSSCSICASRCVLRPLQQPYEHKPQRHQQSRLLGQQARGCPYQSACALAVQAGTAGTAKVAQLTGEDVSPHQPPSASDLLARCARRLRSLMRHQPAQLSYAVADVALYLSEAHEVVTRGLDAPFFSLEGYACAVYGSFEGFLREISRQHFGDSWCFEGGHCSSEPRIMFRSRRLSVKTAAAASAAAATLAAVPAVTPAATPTLS
ncbi:hypothetical protein VOLCADRAFT_117705 [Volvox carteri f. nagariensis]|uniref:RRM domain-containing protein n=1 Tax=Volvox carteri f. nagariensis TaxID=3068 RepID=D8TWW5_VOLCA|nr:uncharacterized protein VOLCADRAFT_117705 [Volvox carteri f. nagariensis]EFJ48223.1 hypothetical protein VOLCADRAFT_117705 [Volvox carteri f. nagariensis]|eukprot:XP_002950908.1 hypothetical protein VOLCADRAFT_117705 [Volvox carteri f. nagariensis]